MKLFIHETASENIVCEMAAILSGVGWGWGRGWWIIKPFLLLAFWCWDRNIAEKTDQCFGCGHPHYGDVIMGAIASQITSLTIDYSTVYSDADQRKHQSSASLAFARGIHRGPVYSPHKWPVTRKMFPFDDVIMLIIGSHGTDRVLVLHEEWFQPHVSYMSRDGVK